MIKNIYNKKLNKYLVFILFLIIGLTVYDDYGFNIDEQFQRSSGFYWLNYISEYFNFNQLAFLAKEKLNNISGFTLDPINYYNKYGIAFDVPAAILELSFKLDSPIEYYHARHLLTFFYFYVGLIFFYKILINRFHREEVAIFGTILLFITPRLLGDSFQNTKDIIFLTFVIISSYYYFKIVDLPSKKNIILFSLFSAISTTIRLFGFFFPISYIIFYFISFSKKNYYKKMVHIFLVLVLFLIFLILFWPLLWENTVENFLSYFKVLGDFMNVKVLFFNNYYRSNLLPYSYLPIWIIISTPIFHLILFLLGFTTIFIRFFKRFINIKNNLIYSDFWRGKSEKKDFFIFFNFLAILCGIIFLNIKLYNSWRIAYFLYFFIIYFATFYFNLFFFQLRNIKNGYKIFAKIFCIFFVLLTSYRTVIYHPYQSLYFNVLTPNKIKNSVEVDYTGLSSIEFLKDTVKQNKNENVIKIGVASWYPIWRMLELLNSVDSKKIRIIENSENYTSDYIYTNRISEVDKRYNKKYNIPDNFIKYKELNIDGAIIYEAYKKKK